MPTEGLTITYRGFHLTVSCARKMEKPTAASGWRKQDRALAAQALQETKVETVEERDPLANLKRLEENRPSFHWRGTQSLKTLVHGTDAPTDKNNR